MRDAAAPAVGLPHRQRAALVSGPASAGGCSPSPPTVQTSDAEGAPPLSEEQRTVAAQGPRAGRHPPISRCPAPSCPAALWQAPCQNLHVPVRHAHTPAPVPSRVTESLTAPCAPSAQQLFRARSSCYPAAGHARTADVYVPPAYRRAGRTGALRSPVALGVCSALSGRAGGPARSSRRSASWRNR